MGDIGAETDRTSAHLLSQGSPMQLSTTFAGVRLRNPIWVASQVSVSHVDAGSQAEVMRRYVDAGAGAVCTPCILNRSLGDPAMQPARRIIGIKDRYPFYAEGLYGLALNAGNLCHLEFGTELMRRLEGIEVPIIANIMGASEDPASWVEVARVMESAGARMIELDTSCPLAAPEMDDGAGFPLAPGFLLGQVPALMQAVTQAVVEAVDIPVMVKLTPELGFPQFIHMADVVTKAGAHAVSAINAPVSIAPPDIKRGGRPPFPFVERYNFSATFGPWDRFLMYKFVAGIRRHGPTPISAVGGIVDPEHVVQAMMLGAQTVQLSSGILWRGVKLISRSLRFLEQYGDQQGFASIDDLVGHAHQYLGDVSRDNFASVLPVLDASKCTLCGICAETTCMALRMDDAGLHLHEGLCSGCGLCVVNCPQDAWTLAPAPASGIDQVVTVKRPEAARTG